MFSRTETDHWHREVPGARWFKADLHVHTIDDLPGGRAKLPPGMSQAPDSEPAIAGYARCFLQKAAARRVRVLGITPHSPCLRHGVSAAWRIVEEWDCGVDDDGTPFRDKIYAVFPGFEPSLNNGKSGLHLSFLFDPEIGRENYLKAFYLVMGGVAPWRENHLRMSGRSAADAFQELRSFHERECPSDSAYLVLAPHIDNDKGLLGAQKAQVLQLFQHHEVAGLELGDGKLPDETESSRPWLKDGMAAHHQAFFHGSDAYAVGDIGERYTWFKLASPRIEALRQAFIASDSRMRLAYERNDAGDLAEIPALDVTVNERPWLKSITVKGRVSFFGSGDEDGATRFDLSPDLTCVIGGSMTGKSTLLDGLRVYTETPLPQDATIKKQVEARGRERFLAGSPEVEMECPASDPTAPLRDRWPAAFHAQNELQRLAQDPEAVEDILMQLAESEKDDIRDRAVRLTEMDQGLRRTVPLLAKTDADLAEAEQAYERCQRAVSELDAFSEAGIEMLHRASRDFREWQDAYGASKEVLEHARRLTQSAESLEVPRIDDSVANVLREIGNQATDDEFQKRWRQLRTVLQSVSEDLTQANAVTKSIVGALEDHERTVRIEVERKLADLGLDGARIREFQALSSQASLLASYQATLQQIRDRLKAGERSFKVLIEDREQLVEQQRAAFDRVIETVRVEFGGRLAARRIDEGDRQPLDRFVKDMNQRGVTRWWNDLRKEKRPSPRRLLDALKTNRLGTFEMSPTVQTTFREALNQSKQRELAAIRCPDRYLLELRMEDDSLRPLDGLSGGQKVSVLLSLLLETRDNRPLVIDQPEDELDNRFLFDTVLPALKRLKGRRQIIVATHNANIVVNGDADQVIQLEATANRGRVAHAGAIEDPAVRDAIVRTVDGGDDAFRLRRLKYGF